MPAVPVSGDDDKKPKKNQVIPHNVTGSKIHYNYCIVVSAQKRGKSGKVYTLKLESENYPVVDKVYSILSA
jgi:hypothetical protein